MRKIVSKDRNILLTLLVFIILYSFIEALIWSLLKDLKDLRVREKIIPLLDTFGIYFFYNGFVGYAGTGFGRISSDFYAHIEKGYFSPVNLIIACLLLEITVFSISSAFIAITLPIALKNMDLSFTVFFKFSILHFLCFIGSFMLNAVDGSLSDRFKGVFTYDRPLIPLIVLNFFPFINNDAKDILLRIIKTIIAFILPLTPINFIGLAFNEAISKYIAPGSKTFEDISPSKAYDGIDKSAMSREIFNAIYPSWIPSILLLLISTLMLPIALSVIFIHSNTPRKCLNP